jgi:hypothetical protein
LRKAKVFALVPLFASLCLSACSYLLDDPYGGFLQKAAAYADLGSALGSSQFLDGMMSAEAQTSTYLFAEFADPSGARMVKALDPMSLELAAFSGQGSPLTFCAATAANAEFVVASHAYGPSTLNLDTACPAGLGWLAADSTTGNNCLFPFVAASSQRLSFYVYDSSWKNRTTIQRVFSSSTENWQLARALILVDGSFAVLAFDGRGGTGSLRAARYPNLAAFLASTGPILDSASSSAVASVDTQQGSIGSAMGVPAWPTVDGLIALVSDANGVFRLARYGYDGLGEKDEYVLSSRPDAALYFESSGTYWYLYERSAGRLFRLRTWW